MTYAEFGGVALSGATLGGVSSNKRDKSAFGALASVPRQDAQLYPYLRWLWIQFPWMALTQASKSSRMDKSKVEEVGAAGECSV